MEKEPVLIYSCPKCLYIQKAYASYKDLIICPDCNLTMQNITSSPKDLTIGNWDDKKADYD